MLISASCSAVRGAETASGTGSASSCFKAACSSLLWILSVSNYLKFSSGCSCGERETMHSSSGVVNNLIHSDLNDT